jgi:hypothetical protein
MPEIQSYVALIQRETGMECSQKSFIVSCDEDMMGMRKSSTLI